MDRTRNPYRELPLRDLWQACQSRAGELLRPADKPRPPEHRQALAADTAHLLLAVAGEIATGEYLPNSPEKDLKGPSASLVDVFSRHYAADLVQLRYQTLTRAADHVLGGERHHWITQAQRGDRRLYDVALESDEGLRLALDALEAVEKKIR